MANEKIVIDPSTDAIVHVDVEPAFMEAHDWKGVRVEAGGLPVPGGHEILPVVLRNSSFFTEDNRYATCDQHPEDRRGSPSGHISWVTSYKGLAPYHDLTLAEVRTWKKGDGRIVSKLFDLGDLKKYLAGCPEQKQTLWPKHAPAGRDYAAAEANLHPAIADLGFRLVLIKGYEATCDSYSGVRDNLGRSTGFAEQLKERELRRIFVDGLAFTHCVGWTALDLAAEGFEVYVIIDATRSVPIPGLHDAMLAQLAAAGVHVITSDMLAAA